MTARGERSSCDASDTKRRCVLAEESSRSSMWFIVDASWAISSPVSGTLSRVSNRAASMSSTSARIRVTGARARPVKIHAPKATMPTSTGMVVRQEPAGGSDDLEAVVDLVSHHDDQSAVLDSLLRHDERVVIDDHTALVQRCDIARIGGSGHDGAVGCQDLDELVVVEVGRREQHRRARPARRSVRPMPRLRRWLIPRRRGSKTCRTTVRREAERRRPPRRLPAWHVREPIWPPGSL